VVGHKPALTKGLQPEESLEATRGETMLKLTLQQPRGSIVKCSDSKTDEKHYDKS